MADNNLPIGASRINQPAQNNLPIGTSPVEKKGFMAEKAGQFIAGINDVTALLAMPLESTFGTITVGTEGVQALSPEETKKGREEGRIGLPGMATEAPQDIMESGFRFAGQTAALGPILGRMFGLVKAPASLPNRVTSVIPTFQKIGRGIKGFAHAAGETFARSPVLSTITETGIGFSAGFGGGVAEKIFPDSDAAKFAGEIIGGLLPSLTPVGLTIRAAGGVRRLWKSIRHPFTEAGGRMRAEARIQRAVPAEEQILEAETELGRQTTLDPKTGQPVLTPVQRTGSPGLLSLERAVVESSEDILRKGDLQIANANEVIQKSLTDIGAESSQSAVIPIVEAHKYLDDLLDTRVRIAAQRTEERIAELGPKVSREQTNLVVREEIEKALDAGVAQQRELYALIPENTAAPYTATQAQFEAFVNQLGRAQQKDIPEVAKNLLSKESDDYFGNHLPPGFKKGETTIKELRSLQSALRQEARNARAGDKKNLNMARIADGIANAIDDDLMNAAAGKKVSEAISVAVNFSRNLNERFNRGTVGKILNRSVTGGDKVPAGLTLEQSIGVTGPKAREAIDDLIKVFDSPEAPNSGLTLEAVNDYMRSRFSKYAIERGSLNVNAARRFVSQNEELLKRLPSLRRQIEEVIDSGETLALTQRQRSRVMLDDPRVSKATFMIEKGPVETFRQIGKLKPQDAARETQMLVNRVSRDASGEALNGLKSGFVEFLFSAARTTKRDVQGRLYLSGFAMRDALAEPGVRAAANRLFSKEELNRIGVITRDLIKLEKRLQAGLPEEGIIGDIPSILLNKVVGIFGAAVGRQGARHFGLGGTVQIPGQTADIFRNMLEANIQNPAARLIRDAVIDETLFKELLEANLLKGKAELDKRAYMRLEAWAATVLAENGGAFSEEE